MPAPNRSGAPTNGYDSAHDPAPGSPVRTGPDGAELPAASDPNRRTDADEWRRLLDARLRAGDRSAHDVNAIAELVEQLLITAGIGDIPSAGRRAMCRRIAQTLITDPALFCDLEVLWSRLGKEASRDARR